MELSLISGPIRLSYYKFLGQFGTDNFKYLGMLCRTIVKIVAWYNELLSVSDPIRQNYSQILAPLGSYFQTLTSLELNRATRNSCPVRSFVSLSGPINYTHKSWPC